MSISTQGCFSPNCGTFQAQRLSHVLSKHVPNIPQCTIFVKDAISTVYSKLFALNPSARTATSRPVEAFQTFPSTAMRLFQLATRMGSDDGGMAAVGSFSSDLRLQTAVLAH